MIEIEYTPQYRCEWVSGSERCHYPGTISHSTLGTGPWYCHEHFRCNDGFAGTAIVRRSEREYPNPDWSVAAVRAREYPPADPTLQPMPRHQVNAILWDLREMLERVQANAGTGTGLHNVSVERDAERDAERAAIQGEAA